MIHQNRLVEQREDFADELRGFALLGIVLVNAPFLGISLQGFSEASLAGPLNRAAALFTVAFAQAKFYVLFSFLFGYSLSFSVKPTAGQAAVVRFKRRLVGLAVLGVLHAMLFFIGDILFLYACLGGVLLWLRHKSDGYVLKFAGITLALWCVLLIAVVLMTAIDPSSTIDPQLKSTEAALQDSSFVTASLARLQAWPSGFALILVLNGLCVLAMFAIGLVAGRRKLLADPLQNISVWRTGSRIGLVVGLPLALTAAWVSVGLGPSANGPGLREISGVVLGFLSAPLLSWGYVSWLALLRSRYTDALRWFRQSGRMSLTGYIGESVILSLIFCGYGLGYFGELGAATVLMIAIGTWLLLELGAKVWLSFARQGPLETILRAGTRLGQSRLD
jgi:uncharacterized protein